MKLKSQNNVLKAVVGAMCLLLVGGVTVGLVKAYSGSAQQVNENVETQNVYLSGAEEVAGTDMLGAINEGKPIAIVYNFLKGLTVSGGTTAVQTLTAEATTIGEDLTIDDDSTTTTIAVGGSDTGPGHLCLANGTEFTIISFSAGTTTPTYATSTACN